jgi:hypothetical protein
LSHGPCTNTEIKAVFVCALQCALDAGGERNVAGLRASALDDPERLIGSAFIKADLGNISGMTFWRLEHNPDPEERLPSPDLIFGSNKRKLWKFGTYGAWKARMLGRGHVKLWRRGSATAPTAEPPAPPPDLPTPRRRSVDASTPRVDPAR